MSVPILNVESRWECPNCDVKDVTYGPVPNRMHNCAGLKGLTAPLVPAGTKCKVEAVERGDYTNGDLCQADADGRVVMSVITTRDDGQDCTVLCPTATASVQVN